MMNPSKQLKPLPAKPLPAKTQNSVSVQPLPLKQPIQSVSSARKIGEVSIEASQYRVQQMAPPKPLAPQKQPSKFAIGVNGNVLKPQQSQIVPKRPKTTAIIRPAIQQYDCGDMDDRMDDEAYFEAELQRNIKADVTNKTVKPTPKAQIILPKLQNAPTKQKQTKDLERELDDQMRRLDIDPGFGSYS